MNLTDNVVWSITKARQAITKKEWIESIVPIDYRPFDRQLVVYHPTIVGNLRRPVMSQLIGGQNLCLLTCRQQIVPGFKHVLVTRNFFECCIVSLKSREKTTGFPLWVAKNDLLEGGRFPNIRETDLHWLTSALAGKRHRMEDDVVVSAFHMIYAQLHSPVYRQRYSDFLQRGFPRVFQVRNQILFDQLAKLGGELVALHLMESPKLDKHITRFIGKGSQEVEKISYSDETVWIDKAKTHGFQGVPENVWNFHIGGYQVCEKWLKDRGPKSGKPARTLSADDINHYHRIIVAINETIRIMAEIDKVIEAHGGWPDAFLSKQEKASSGYDVQPQPVLKAAEKMSEYKKQKSSATLPKILPLKRDWKTWFALSQWAKETMQINSYWIDFALEIGKNLKEGKPLTDKQKEDMGKCWQQAVNKGFKP